MDEQDNQRAVDQLWYEVENSTWTLGDIGHIARKMGYLASGICVEGSSSYDGYFPTHVPASIHSPEWNYWINNGTFALFILAAEGELE